MSAERPQWAPTETEDTSTSRCQNCDAQVSRHFARVFGDNDDVPHACPECSTNRELAREASNAGRR